MAVTTVDESFGANVSVQLLGDSVGVDATGGTGGFPRDASSEFCSSRQACQATRIWAFSRKVSSRSGKKSAQWFSKSASWGELMPKVARVHPAVMSSADKAGASPAWDKIWSRSWLAIMALEQPGAPGAKSNASKFKKKWMLLFMPFSWNLGIET